MKKSGKRLNILDIGLIVLLIAVVAVGAYVIYANMSVAGVNKDAKKIQFDVEITDIMQEGAESWKVGDHVTFGDKNKDEGVIVAVQAEPYKVVTEDTQNGTFVLTENPAKYQVVLTIEAESVGYTGSGDLTDGTVTSLLAQSEEIRVGMQLPVRSKTTANSGFIISVDER